MYISDSEFIRGECPMTKEEIRILSTAKMNLKEDSRVLDIGAGTGSMSIQMAKLCKKGEVIAIEMDSTALDLINRNKIKFKADNLTVVAGDALEVEKSITPYFDGIFVGGSKGSIDKIIKSYDSKLKPGGKMVLNFITLRNLNIALETLESLNYKIDCIQVSVSRVKGKSRMIFSNNSIFIVTAFR
ncbi:precorrin-6Y C5,15-methyltransferase (decarboxylating) subunit CbiT [Clostridium sp. cel8]|jgi:cobalt-precorrin-6B (C15)-methyltransferase|uniref:precorrin-6Y C5,15-methyltransferase (decarboxylating) subunit CbiT n=1 Tax=unclassified Clostridium TaxID=2614128 RepID=UPI0015F58B1F|nr:precorrin-6Y C5,15-methyltransferase (decarboxylating) subunit CbiT [Clostridium sp. cel8]MBA5850979.1 precorrin-6Y C5,15-methyltransferase (decarboxylating) subunit CbiT [Clostridium sp. cel8]